MCVHTTSPHTSFHSLTPPRPARLSHKGVNGNFYFGEENEAKKRDLLKRDKNFSKQWKGNFKMLSRKKKTLTFEGFAGKGGRGRVMVHTQSPGSCGDSRSPRTHCSDELE